MTWTRKEIEAAFESMDESVLLMDGFDEAFIGYSQRGNEPCLAVYSWSLMVNHLVERDGMVAEEAAEYVDYNCVRAWVGDRTPIIVMPIMDGQ